MPKGSFSPAIYALLNLSIHLEIILGTFHPLLASSSTLLVSDFNSTIVQFCFTNIVHTIIVIHLPFFLLLHSRSRVATPCSRFLQKANAQVAVLKRCAYLSFLGFFLFGLATFCVFPVTGPDVPTMLPPFRDELAFDLPSAG